MMFFGRFAVFAVVWLAGSVSVAVADDMVSVPIHAEIGQSVILDPTDGFTAADGTVLRAAWGWADRPAVSVAEFSDPTALRPVVTVDVAGTYVARLELYPLDDLTATDPLYTTTVEISTENLTPVAQIVGRSTADFDARFILDGSDSYDVDGDALTYLWSVAEQPPAGSVVFADPTSPLTDVTFDGLGAYTLALTVQDATGRMSAPALYALDLLGDDAVALDLTGTLGTFNLVTNYLESSQTVQGRSYVGATLNAVAGQFGTNLPADGAAFAALSVDGDIRNSHVNLVQGATALISGVKVDSFVNNGVLIEGATDLPVFDFDQFKADSAFLASLTGAAPDLSDQNHKRFGGAANADLSEAQFGANTRIVHTSLQDLQTGGYSVDVSTVDTVIINVSGTTGRFQMNPLGGTAAAPKVIWNFYEATSLDINAVLMGHVLAPHATLRGFAGGTEGTVIADDVRLTNGPLRQRGWAGDIPLSAPAPTDTRNVAPTGALFFDQQIGDGSVAISAQGSTDLDAQALSAGFDVIFGAATAATDAGAVLSLDAAGQAGDILVAARVSDGVATGADQILIAAADGAVRPAAVINTGIIDAGVLPLDGTQSYDLNGDLLSYEWSLLSAPTGSLATLNAAAPTTSLPVDVAGTYIAQLVVHDGVQSSVPQTVVINTAAALPVADAGPDGLADASGLAVLDGALSTGATLDFAWSPTAITGSASTLTTPTQVTTDIALAADGAGGFAPSVAQFVVTDETGISRPDTAFVSRGNIRPTLAQGAPVVTIGETVVSLSAADYAFDANADALSYVWSIASRPAGSAAVIDPANPGAKTLAADALDFGPDRVGSYLIQLTASDGVLAARPAVITVTVENTAPTALVAGLADTFVGTAVTLDGTGSFDLENNALRYQWSITNRPAGSTAVIADATLALTSFVPEVKGVYTFALVVTDFGLSSDPAVASLNVPNQAPQIVIDAPTTINVRDTAVFDASGAFDPDGDPLTFAITVTPATGGTAQIEELPGGIFGVTPDQVGDYTVVVSVSDGEVTETSTTTLTASASNAAPILGDLRDSYTVELGLEFALNLTAMDPDGDATTFYANPLPLATGISLDGSTGAVRFRPEAGQIGIYTLTLGVSDGALTDEAAITIEVVAGTASDTSVFGRVLDAVDFENGVETPLAGIPVRLDGAGLQMVTDAAGGFAFGSLIAGSDTVLIDPNAAGGPGGYLATTRGITITENQNRDLSPEFLLTPLNEGCVTVVAGQDTVLTGSVTGAAISIAADTVLAADGSLYTGEVCLGSLPQRTPQAGLPADTLACQIYGLSAADATFSAGISIAAPNDDNLPESTVLTLWTQSGTGVYRRAATANVDPGATTVSSSDVGFGSDTFFTFLPQAPRTVASDDMPTGNRQLSVFEGDLNEVYTLPGYFAFNQQQQVGLSYHSAAADPTVIVAGDVTIADDMSLPVTMSTRIIVGGLSIASDADWTPRQGADGSTPALVGEVVNLRQSMPVDATGLASGRYPYDFIARANYDCSTVSARHKAELYVQNETDSPYGVGWSIDGLQELTQNPDGSIAIIDDDGIATFNPKPTFTEFEEEPLVFPSVGTVGIVLGDFDGNGLTDFAFGEAGTGRTSVGLNYGNRQFEILKGDPVTAPHFIPQTGDYEPPFIYLTTLDYNQDGVPDLLAIDQDVENLIPLVNDGNARFTADAPIASQNSVTSIADFDNDGFLDFIVPAGFFFNGSGYFSPGYYYGNGIDYDYVPTGGFRGFSWGGGPPLQSISADMDNDGFTDIVYRARTGIAISYISGTRGRMGFTNFRLGSSPARQAGSLSAIGDLNGDGFQDIVISDDDILQMFLNVGPRAYSDAIEITRPAGADDAGSVNLIDLDSDGNLDLLYSGLSDAAAGDLAIYRGLGDGTFEPPQFGQINHPIGRTAIADLDGDGSLDLISTQRFSVTVDFSNPSASGDLVSGSGEFSTLTKLDDGTFERRYKDGMVVVFNAEGLQTAEVDPQGNRREFAYGEGGRLATVTDQVGGETTFTYDSLGRLASTTYPDGRTTTFSYDDADGALTEVTEPTGSKVSFAYDDDGRLVSTTNQNGNSTAYSYDSIGKFSTATLPDGSNIAASVAQSLGLADGLGNSGPIFFVAPEDRVTTVTDRKGEVTEVIVNEFGSPIQTTDPLGRVTRMERDTRNLVVRVERPSDTTPGGVRVDEIDYDGRANVTRMAEAVGTPQERATQYTYEPEFNRVVSMTDADGFTTAYEYDAFGELTKTTDPEGGARLMAYNAKGQITSRTDENGNETAFIYNSTGNLGQMTYADGSISTMIYDATGNTTAVNEAVGTDIARQVQRTYDRMNRVLTVEVTGADGAQIDGVTSYTYEPAGNLATVTDETGLVTEMFYDPLERLVALDDPAEGLIQRTYNDAGEVTEHINGDGEIHQYAYDEVSRLSQTIDPEGFVKSFAYDTRNNVTGVTDGRGGVTTFGFDPLDRMTTRTNPIGQTMTRAYDGRDNLSTLTREDGLVETASYDGLGRRTQVVTPDNTLTYGYDARSNLTEAADDDSRVTFTYDARNRLASTTTDGTVGPQPEVTISYTYDALDRRTSMSDSLGGTTTYAYDFEDRLTDLTAPWGTVYSFGYDGEGRRTSLTSTSGRDTSYGYTNGLLTALSHAQSGVALTELVYGYDVDGQLLSITDNLDPTKSLAINYDDLNRLVQVDQGDPAGVALPIEDYAYDGEGNRLASHLSALYSSNDHNQLLEDDSYTYAYDVRGNRASRADKASGAVETYTYDSQNRLIGYTSDTTTASYAYDAMDRRIAKTVDGEATSYIYDMSSAERPLAQDDILLEFNSGLSERLERRFLHNDDVDEPISFESYDTSADVGSGTSYEVYVDRQGSVTTIVDGSTREIAAAYEYDSYGQPVQTHGTLQQPYGYIGREYDSESGLYHYRVRALDSRIGSFIQDDVIGFGSGQANLYTYTANDPVNNYDPSGLASQSFNAARMGAGSAGTGLYSTSSIYSGVMANSSLISGQLAGMGRVLKLAGQASRARGLNGEAAVAMRHAQIGLQQIRYYTVRGNYRVADFLNVRTGVLTEVKNVAYQAYTRQLRDAIAYVGHNNMRLRLFVRPNTKLSQPLQEALRKANTFVEWIPGL